MAINRKTTASLNYCILQLLAALFESVNFYKGGENATMIRIFESQFQFIILTSIANQHEFEFV